MKIWILRAGMALSALVAIALVVVWSLLRGSLPQLGGELTAAGLDAPASIARDSSGIPVITAESRADLAYATGFAHAQDRYFQMDLIRRQSAGELSELFGEAAVEVDKRYRFHRFRARAQAVLDMSSAEDRALVEAYALGVNDGLASLSVRPFEYLLLNKQPEPWVAEDSILIVYAMFMQLNDDRARKDVRRGLSQLALPGEVYAWLYPDGTPWDAPIMGAPREVTPYPSAAVFSIRDRDQAFPDNYQPANEQGRPPLNGSNNWAVDGSLTADGRALVSNDMHLGLSVPNIWYQARLVTTGEEPRDVTGVSLPGTPFVVAGSNGNIAWGYTNSYGDWSDAVIVTPGATGNTYRTADGDESFVEHVEVIDVDGGEAVEYRIRETRWGPVDDRVSFDGREIAVSWLAHKPEAVNLRLIGLETVGSVAEALETANAMGMPPQNFVVGDTDGNIGWTIAGQIPVKTDYDAMLPADWSEADGWAGWRAPAEYPRVVNPESGRIWTANARVADGDALAIIGDGGYDLAARAKQIRDNLFEADEFSPEDMLRIQRDSRALFLERWRDLLLEVLSDERINGDAGLAEYRELVEAWIPEAAPESTGYRLVRAFRLETRQRVFDGLTGPVRDRFGEDADLLIGNQFEAPLWQLLTERPQHLLPADYDTWEALLVSAVQRNIEIYDSNYGGELSERTWGEYNTARIAHPLSRAVPQLADWLNMPLQELHGDANLPLAQGPDFGASERFSVSPGDEENGLMQMPTGQSGHPMSDFYRVGHSDWVDGTPSPFLPGPAVHELRLLPPASDAVD